jgi:hypothetical protein
VGATGGAGIAVCTDVEKLPVAEQVVPELLVAQT